MTGVMLPLFGSLRCAGSFVCCFEQKTEICVLPLRALFLVGGGEITCTANQHVRIEIPPHRAAIFPTNEAIILPVSNLVV